MKLLIIFILIMLLVLSVFCNVYLATKLNKEIEARKKDLAFHEIVLQLEKYGNYTSDRKKELTLGVY